MKVRPQVGIIPMKTSAAHANSILIGLAKFQARHELWQMQYEGETERFTHLRIEMDGLLAAVDSRPDTWDLLATVRCPIVNIAADILEGPLKERFPRILPDEEAVGKLVAEHFLARCFKHFAFQGIGNFRFSQLRQRGFVDTLAQAGFTCQEYIPEGLDWDSAAQAPVREKWLHELARPCGIFAADDARAYHLVQSCQSVGIRVPEDVAIVGVNDEEPRCQMANPQLSSVGLDGERAGWEAATLLARLMAGEPSPEEPILVPPKGLVTRRSSDFMMIDDVEVRTAMRFIWDHAAEPLSVADVVGHVPLCRSQLERRFRKATNRTLQEEISRVHVDRAKQLLQYSDLSVAQVARSSGFTSPQRLAEAFHKAFTITPTAYRRRAQRQTSTSKLH
jgi:LacI family transcriptional regulator